MDKEEAVEANRILEALQEHLAKIAKGAPCDVYLWPRSSGDVPDSKRLKIVFLGPELRYGRQETQDFARDLLITPASPSASTGIPYLSSRLTRALRRIGEVFAAVPGASGDSTGQKPFPYRRRPGGGPEEAEGCRKRPSLPDDCRLPARGWYGNGTVIWRDVGLPTVGEKSLSARIFQNLKSEERVLSLITPKLILERASGRTKKKRASRRFTNSF